MSKPKLSAQEMAVLLEIDRRTLYRWVESGRLTAGRTLTKQLVFNPEHVEADYARAGATIPDTFAAWLKKPADAHREQAAASRAESRGAA